MSKDVLFLLCLLACFSLSIPVNSEGAMRWYLMIRNQLYNELFCISMSVLPPSCSESHFFKTNFSKLLFPNACLPTEVVKFIFTTHYISFFTCNPIMILATKVDYVPWPLISLVSTFSYFHEKLKTKAHLGWRDHIVRFFWWEE